MPLWPDQFVSTADASSGAPAGPAGCGVAIFVIGLTVLLVAGFLAAIWWMMNDIGQA